MGKNLHLRISTLDPQVANSHPTTRHFATHKWPSYDSKRATYEYLLLTDGLGEAVEGGLSTLSITEKTYANAFPIAGTHGEGIACF